MRPIRNRYQAARRFQTAVEGLAGIFGVRPGTSRESPPTPFISIFIFPGEEENAKHCIYNLVDDLTSVVIEQTFIMSLYEAGNERFRDVIFRETEAIWATAKIALENEKVDEPTKRRIKDFFVIADSSVKWAESRTLEC